MKRIKLKGGKFTTVDNRDYKELSKFAWYPMSNRRKGAKIYPSASVVVNGKRTTVRMARMIMGAKKGMEVDHKDHDTLNNCRKNLRLCTRSENNYHRRMRSDSKNGYKGIARSGKYRWKAKIWFQGKRHHLGGYPTKELAAEAYNKAARKLHKQFAVISKLKRAL